MRRITTFGYSVAVAAGLFVAAEAMAGAHTWRVNEVFSTEDGSIQFIELRECCGGDSEVFLNGNTVSSDSTGNVFTFPSNLQGPTGNKHILLATQSFADLPGAPTPDHIIPEGFFDPTGDTVSYHVYHDWTFGAIPTDCVNSLTFSDIVAKNSPTNYSDETGSVVACETSCAGDLNGDNVVNVSDLLDMLGQFGDCPSCDADLNGDDVVNVSDLLALLGVFGPCP